MTVTTLAQIQAEVFDALAHPLRLKILEKLRAGPCCVCKIMPYVGAEQSNVSHHLAILKNAGLVRCEKRGLEVWYEVFDPRVFTIIDDAVACIAGTLKQNHQLLKTIAKARK